MGNNQPATLGMHPVDYFNAYGDFSAIFQGVKGAHFLAPDEVAMLDPDTPAADDLKQVMFRHHPKHRLIKVLRANSYNFSPNSFISKFELLTAARFKGNQSEALYYVQFSVMGMDFPYMRVGCDYYKIVERRNRYGHKETYLKVWRKEEIKLDYGTKSLQSVAKYEDFTIEPDNKNYRAVIDGCYNHYSKFQHVPVPGPTGTPEGDFPVTYNFMQHIFGEHLHLGFRYMQLLYQHPKSHGPVLCLVSKEQKTGKTTFINWLYMIFGNNSTVIFPEQINKDFNSSYSTKNIVTIDESFSDSNSKNLEKVKNLSTAKRISVMTKFVSDYNVDGYIKLVMCTNKVHDFMRIERQDLRFWVREIPSIKKENALIEGQLAAEIPAFLAYLDSLPAIKLDKSRMGGFLPEEIRTSALLAVMEHSKSDLCKEIEYMIGDFFDSHDLSEFRATATDIKNRWFKGMNYVKVHQISAVLRGELGMKPERNQYYKAFDDAGTEFGSNKKGTPFLFKGSEREPEGQGIINYEGEGF